MSLVNQMLRDLDKTTPSNAALKFEVVEASSKLNSKLLWYGFAILLCLGIYTLIISINGKQHIEPVQNISPKLASSSQLNQLDKSVKNLPSTKLVQATNQQPAIVSLPAEQPLDAVKIAEETAPAISALPVEPEQLQSKATPNLSTSSGEVATVPAPMVTVTPEQVKPTPARQAIQPANRDVSVKTESLQSQLNNQLVAIKRSYSRGQQELAVTNLTSLLLAAPDFHAARIYLIKICWQQSLCPTFDLLDKAVKTFPRNAEYRLMAARFYFESKAFETAGELLKNIHSNQANYQELLQLRALTSQNLQQHNAALMDYAELLKRSPNRGDIFLAMGISFDALGEQIKAQQSFQRALQDQRLSARQHQFATTKISQYQG